MLNYPNIDPILFRLGPLAFRWYGFMYLLGFIAGYLFLSRQVRVKKGLSLSNEDIGDAVTYAAFGVILGGRIGYTLFYNFSYYFEHPIRIFYVWEGGMSFHGGFLGTLIAMILYAKQKKISFFQIADYAIPAIPIGLGLGRLGNFINGELFGRATDVPWCMVFPNGGSFCRHPSQLYEALLEGLTLFLILLYLNGKKLPQGALFWSFIAWYGSFRFIAEFFREPDPQLGLILGPFSMGQFLSFPMALLGFGMILYLLIKKTT
jgi:phosphatidylglycerol:prolipoprotein diacylglycerol transferase